MAKVTYALAIGSLMYVMICTTLDIAYAMEVVSIFMPNPSKQHYEAVKWMLRYLYGTTKKCLHFRRSELKLEGYVDVDFANEIDNWKSTIGYVFTLGTTAINWISQLQKIVILCTIKVKYVTITKVSKEMIWLQSLLAKLGFKQDMNVLHSNSQSAIHLAKYSAFHSRTNYITLCYHFIRFLLEDRVLTLVKIQDRKNLVNMLTQIVITEKLELCATSIGQDRENRLFECTLIPINH